MRFFNTVIFTRPRLTISKPLKKECYYQAHLVALEHKDLAKLNALDRVLFGVLASQINLRCLSAISIIGTVEI